MKKTALVALLVLAVVSTAAAGPENKTTTVYGMDNQAVDRAAIQDAIDSAPKNGTVELVGTFQLDGEFIFINRDHITIEGRAVDNDGDGSVNEDWGDGVDNDADGLVDEDDWDTVIKGLLDGDGLPIRDLFPPDRKFFNRGFAVWGAEGAADQITIRNLKLTGLNRPIGFAAGTVFSDGLFCDDIELSDGFVKNAVVEGNWFDNTVRGAQIWGASEHVRFSNNLMTRTQGAGILLVGGGSFCFAADGSASSVVVGTPEKTVITGNLIRDKLGGGGIQTFGAQQSHVDDNRIDSAAHGIYIEGDSKAHVFHNIISNVNHGLLLVFDGSQSQASNNTITDATNGVLFLEATGWTANNNFTANIGNLDYYFDPLSSDNRVVLLPGQTFFDEGTGNIIQ